MTNKKVNVWVYFSTYGSHKHDVCVIEVGDKAGETFRNDHIMLYRHDRDFLAEWEKKITPFMNEAYVITFVENPHPNN